MATLPTRGDDGTVNGGPVLFLTTYVLLVNWTLLPVSMAVLVDRFVVVSASAAADERAQRVREAKEGQLVRTPPPPPPLPPPPIPPIFPRTRHPI